MKTDKTGRPGN